MSETIERQLKKPRTDQSEFTPSSSTTAPPPPAIVPPQIVCPYLDTVDRRMLDFDFDKVCSVTLQHHNVYGCLVCGKFFQGRGNKSSAYTHSVALDHHVFINLHSGRFYCLPDDYEVIDHSLADIQYNLNPKFTSEEILGLDSGLAKMAKRALDGNEYHPGYVGLNNLNQTDWLNVTIQCLNRVLPLRNFFMDPENYKSSISAPFIDAFGELIRKMWNPKNYKAHVSPHELIQAITSESEKMFRIGDQADPIKFLSWLLNSMHRSLVKIIDAKYAVKKSSSKRALKSSIVTDTFQGIVQVFEVDANNPFGQPRISEVPFFYLSLKLPENPLFEDELKRDIIPQVSIFDILSKFNGQTREYLTVNKNGVDIPVIRRYRIKKLPHYLIIHYSRFLKNQFFIEKNSSIVNFPMFGLDLTPYVSFDVKKKPSKQDLITLSISELKSKLIEHKVSLNREVEKSELVDKLYNKLLDDYETMEESTNYSLVGNIVHESFKKEQLESSISSGKASSKTIQIKGSYRAQILKEENWLEIQDLVVSPKMTELVAVSESYIQFWERR